MDKFPQVNVNSGIKNMSDILSRVMQITDKYMITSTQITNTEVLAFITVLDFKLLRYKILLINRKDNGNC